MNSSATNVAPSLVRSSDELENLNKRQAGTLFLDDEIGDMPLVLQAKLLRVIQEREFTRIGGRDTLKCDVRILPAANKDLAAAVREQLFRARTTSGCSCPITLLRCDSGSKTSSS